eukprot:723461-Hanusia_phi.AAC.1
MPKARSDIAIKTMIQDLLHMKIGMLTGEGDHASDTVYNCAGNRTSPYHSTTVSAARTPVPVPVPLVSWHAM